MATRLNPAGLAKVRQNLTPLALKGAGAAVEVAQDKLTGPGSGRQYPGLPNRSSAEGEYPAEQSGDLRDSMAAEAVGEGRALFGPIHNPPPYVRDLHFKPPSDGGRPFMDDLFYDRDIHRAVRAAVGAK